MGFLLYALFLLLALAYCGGSLAEVVKPAKKDPIWVRSFPPMGLAPLRVMLIVRSEDLKFTCPRLTVDWGGGSISSEESDCDPEDIPRSFSWSRQSPFLGEGDHTFTVTLEQQGRRTQRDVVVHVK